MLSIRSIGAKRKLFVVTAILVITGAFYYSQVAMTNKSNAIGGSWMSGTLTGTKDNSQTIYSSYGTCNQQTVKLSSQWAPGYTEKNACLFTAKSYRYAIIDGTLYISVGADQKMYPLINAGFASYSYVLPSPETNDFIFGKIVAKDFLSSLTLNTSTASNYYEQSVGSSYDLAKDEQGNVSYGTRGLAISHNGKWQVVNFQGIGLVRFNLDNMSATRIAQYTSNLSLLAISNDGAYVAESASGSNYEPVIYSVDSCGQTGTTLQSSWVGTTIVNPCPSRNVTSAVNAVLGTAGSNVYEIPDFSDDGSQLILYAYGYGANHQVQVTLNAAGYVTPQKLDYLALGDSYSSGEGDTARNPANNNQKYYRFGTDTNEDINNNIPREKCHISTRSYPYILSNGMGLGNPLNVSGTKWQSVACSGAQMVDVIPEERDSDRGQGSRLNSISNYAELKAQALNEFIPGRVKQIEFVKKYKPKVITLTMGGNDVGFAAKITQCAWPGGGTCRSATPEGRQTLKSEILGQYGKLKSLYDELYRASGGHAKIYVLGYPQFLSNEDMFSCSGIASINYEEREMIYSGVSYLNEVIKTAAAAAGVKYVDIEDSLTGHRLCDSGDKYVTPVVGKPISISNEGDESFHPNARGHFEIAMTVWDELNHESLLDYDTCPNTTENACPDVSATKESIVAPSYFSVTPTTNAHYVDLTSGQTKKTELLTVKTDSYTLRPQSAANITVHSDPIDLGDYTVNTNGSLTENVTMPSTVPVGYHTLIVTGETYSGEPVQYEQIVLVTGTNPGDLDDNGIVDSDQPCGAFVAASNQDTDLDGIDDACDPEISNAPQLYRTRSGDASRQYNGSAEHEDYLYIERNTRVSTITGVSGDYDPDNDGWAIVGVSQGTPYSTTSVPDTAPAANFNVVGEGASATPYVYIRAGGYGCVSFAPTSLAVVQSGQNRTIKKVAYNTNKCRQEPLDYDVDGNGQPDNTQPLYEAHQGNTAKGEDSSRIYLSRNFYASEAQLGISDYTPTGTPASNPTQPIQEWNLLASSKPGEYIPAFNKLVILKDSNNISLPTILTKKLNGQCIAYQPESTEIIKMTTQNTRYLKKLASVPGGVGCE